MKSGSRTLKDAINEALRDWVTNADNTYYCFGTVAGPHPFPVMVRDFQRIIGLEARQQVLASTGRLPDAIAACVGGGSNAIGIFHAFIDDADVRLIGFEAAGDGVETGRHAATFSGGTPGALPRRILVPVAGRGRSDRRIAFHLSRTGLSGRRSRAFLPTRHRPGRVPGYHRYRSHERLQAAVPHRGHHPGHRVLARHRRRADARPGAGQGRDHPGKPLRTRRQGRRYRGRMVRPDRRRRRATRTTEADIKP